ncbi:MAG: pentapeptide repeat-containing protein [Bacteroidales bacterium]|nr:pentapeptide repeat-containing protein [Bacteroidales bacterium]
MMKIYLFIITGLIMVTCISGNVPPGKGGLDDLIESGKDVFFKDMTFNEDIDFTKYGKNLISEGVYQVRIVSSITFQNCIFRGKVAAYDKNEDNTITLTSFQSNLSFIGCTFHDTVSFRAACVTGRTDFTTTSFLKAVSFEECTFFQNAYFRGSTYHEEARFQNAVFLQKANFLNTEFDVTMSFQNAIFHGEAQFSSAKFMGYADFGLISCHGNFFANYAVFDNRAVFNHGFYNRQADFNNVSFNHAEIMNCRFMGETRFQKSTVREYVSLENSLFLISLPDLGSFDREKLSTEGIRTLE